VADEACGAKLLKSSEPVIVIGMLNNPPKRPHYRGRFAPSPTGPLHFGSIVTAVGSYLEARTHDGEWLVRIENLDKTREVVGASKHILNTLTTLGMEWDGDVLYQDQRNESYRAAFATLEYQQLIYPCTCTRKEIADSSIIGEDGPIYTGICRARSIPGARSRAYRVKTDSRIIAFNDVLQGRIQQRVQASIGDFILRRTDGVYAYQLAVVVDDAEQGVTHVVRGADLLNSTPRQIYLQQLLDYSTPEYMHLPVAVNAGGEKLSKQTQAASVDPRTPVPNLVAALSFLGQQPPADLSECGVPSFWDWALQNWKPEIIPPIKFQFSGQFSE
jgi:glutamyl-Q tRNA(Asp) synthetase